MGKLANGGEPGCIFYVTQDDEIICKTVSHKERTKGNRATYKDLDFMEMYPEGILLQSDLYNNLIDTIERDCRALESLKIMDYSLLLGIHNVDQANAKKQQPPPPPPVDPSEVGDGQRGESEAEA